MMDLDQKWIYMRIRGGGKPVRIKITLTYVNVIIKYLKFQPYNSKDSKQSIMTDSK